MVIWQYCLVIPVNSKYINIYIKHLLFDILFYSHINISLFTNITI